MQWTSALAIFVLFWWLCLFLVLPFHARRSEDDAAPMVPGQAESAPVHFRFWAVAGQVTLIAAAAFGLYYANYVFGWVTLDNLLPTRAPARG
jgi:predicted secreted protein